MQSNPTTSPVGYAPSAQAPLTIEEIRQLGHENITGLARIVYRIGVLQSAGDAAVQAERDHLTAKLAAIGGAL